MAIARNTPFTLSKINMLELKEELCLVYSMVRQKCKKYGLKHNN